MDVGDIHFDCRREYIEQRQKIAALEAKLAKAREALEFYSQRKHLDWIGSSELYTRKECEIDAWELAKNFLSIEMGNKAREALKELADE
jgi:hypothetical protein